MNSVTKRGLQVLSLFVAMIYSFGQAGMPLMHPLFHHADNVAAHQTDCDCTAQCFGHWSRGEKIHLEDSCPFCNIHSANNTIVKYSKTYKLFILKEKLVAQESLAEYSTCYSCISPRAPPVI